MRKKDSRKSSAIYGIWVVLKFVPDWRWFLDRSDSPWYPSMRLFRQPAYGDWDGAFTAVEAELKKMVASQ